MSVSTICTRNKFLTFEMILCIMYIDSDWRRSSRQAKKTFQIRQKTKTSLRPKMVSNVPMEI